MNADGPATPEDAWDSGDSVGPPAEAAPLEWPPTGAGPDALPCVCPACGVAWRVDRDLAGFRLRCRCGAFISVAAPTPPPRTALLTHAGAHLPAPAAADVSFAALVGPAAAVFEEPQDEYASDARPTPTSKAINVAILELLGLFLGLILPSLLIFFAFPGDRQAIAMPFAGLVGGIVVLCVGAASRAFDASALRGAHPLRFAEGLGVAAGFFFVALGLTALVERAFPEVEDPLAPLVQVLGLSGALFAVAFCPGVFEEIAFRGVLHGRLLMIFGRPQHYALGATAFALAHGVSFATPIHFGLGYALCRLRDRSGSVWPGVLAHMAYNGALVWRSAPD